MIYQSIYAISNSSEQHSTRSSFIESEYPRVIVHRPLIGLNTIDDMHNQTIFLLQRTLSRASNTIIRTRYAIRSSTFEINLVYIVNLFSFQITCLSSPRFDILKYVYLVVVLHNSFALLDEYYFSN